MKKPSDAATPTLPASDRPNPLPRTFVVADAAVPGPDASRKSDCVDGGCATTNCPANFLECDGRCVDATRAQSCGSCEPCAAGQQCVAGRCEGDCPRGTERCGERCVDLDRDVQHCGSCGSACPTGSEVSATCAAGECRFSCVPGYTLCRGECIADVLLLPVPPAPVIASNCDTLTVVRQLAAGAVACLPDHIFCDGSCTDVKTDSAHCGTCDSSCAPPARCRDARCVLP